MPTAVFIAEVIMVDTIEGIDVSGANGVIDWSKVAQAPNVNFVFCKATEGVTFTDAQFQKNWQAIKDGGWVRGAYHFARHNDPIEEADHFLEIVGLDLEDTDMLVLDIEVSNLTGPKFVEWVLSWVERIEEKTCRTPIIYTGGPFFDSHDGKPSPEVLEKLSKYPLWLAAYTNTPDKFVPPAWKDTGWSLWQKSGDVAPRGSQVLRVPGIKTNVDRNIWRGDLDSLKDFALSLHVQNDGC